MWGMAFTAQRVGAEHVGPLTFNAVRFAMGAALISAVALFLDFRRGVSPRRRRQMRRDVMLPGLACGGLLTLATGLQQIAIKDTTAGNAAFVTGLYLLLVPLFGLLVGHRISWLTGAGIALALGGLYLIAGTSSFSLTQGDGLVMVSAVCFALQILAVDHWVNRLPALRFAAAQFWTCAIASSIGGLIFDRQPFGNLEAAAVPLAYGGLISVGLAYTFQVLGQRDAEPTPAALIMASETVFGALGGAIMLHENMGLRGYGGALAMTAGIVLSQLSRPASPAAHAATGSPPKVWGDPGGTEPPGPPRAGTGRPPR
jgi:drug/metabolite transporter (DMT)-like permease